MAQNKDQLNKLLQFIKQLIEEPGNEDFVKGLRKLLDVPTQGSPDNGKISDIEKYLGLDYKLDSAAPDIDFSFVKEPFVRDQLTSDYREMLRYRYGVRSHKIDFSEYCRYAMLQVEQLLNYYYQHKFDSEEALVEFINENSFTILAKFDSIKSLSLAVKLSAFSKKLERKHSSCLDFAREVRNEQSHRSTDEVIGIIKAFREKLHGMRLPLTKEGEVDWYRIKDDSALLLIYDRIDQKAYWKYRYQIWRLKQPFGDIAEAVKAIALQVNKELGQKI